MPKGGNKQHTPDEQQATAAGSDDQLSKHGFDTPVFSLSEWEADVRVVDVYDADSVQVVVEFRGHPWKFNCRLQGLDACELRTSCPELRAHALRARDRLLSLLTTTSPDTWSGLSRAEVRSKLEETCCICHACFGDFDKYGRVLVKLWKDVDVGGVLLQEGLAYAYDGGTKWSDAEKRARLLGHSDKEHKGEGNGGEINSP